MSSTNRQTNQYRQENTGGNNGYIQERVQCGIQRFVSPLSFLSWDSDAATKSAPEHTR